MNNDFYAQGQNMLRTDNPIRLKWLIAAICATKFLSACGGHERASVEPNEQDEPERWSTLPDDYVPCADQEGQCNFTGSVKLAYGVSGNFAALTLAGPFDCNNGNSIFGDLAPTVVKSCYIPRSALSAPEVGALASTPLAAITPLAATTAYSSLATAKFAATSDDIPNPDRGFYRWVGGDLVTGFNLNSVQSAYDAGYRLVMGKVQLDAYRNSDLPASFLSALSSRFASLRSAGMKVTLLFNYDFTSGGNDASATQIKRHLEQLKPVLMANADVIPYMRAGFIGAWGEWHSSKSGNSCGYNSGTTPCATADANRAVVRDALLSNVPLSTQIGFRYPADLIKWYPSAKQQRRAGVHNDCFLAGPTDTGTYQTNDQRKYVKTLSANTAFGGENCEASTPLRMSCDDILTEGPAYHLAWLNNNDFAGFISSWRNGGCLNTVSAFMGYRLQLDGVTHDRLVARGGRLSVLVNLRNVGWAKVFTARQLVVTLVHRVTGATIRAAGGDLSTLPSQATSSSTIRVVSRIPVNAATGDYDVYLSAPDVFTTTASDPRFAIRFANANQIENGQVWESTTGRFKVGTTVTVPQRNY